MYSWNNWRDHPQGAETPYVAWFRKVHKGRLGPKPKFVRQVVPRAVNQFHTLDHAETTLAAPEETTAGPSTPFVIRAPAYLTNQKFAKWWNNRSDKSTWLPPAKDFECPTVPADTLLAGIIDIGLPMGHSRFRLENGQTRVLGHWLQGAPVPTDTTGTPKQPFLPFGAQLMEADINATLQAFSVDQDLSRPLDQDGFNRATGLVNFHLPEGERGLATRATHGAHVMGLVGGADAKDPLQSTFSKRTRFLLVTLPPEFAFGEGGTFLDFYLIYALRWILEMNARIAAKSGLSKPLPLVTNISIGKHAGAKDAAEPFVAELLDQDHVPPLDAAVSTEPFHAILAAGNSNLERAAAHVILQPGEEKHLDWMVPPNDDTSNFLEIWNEQPSAAPQATAPLEIELVPPGQPQSGTSAGMDAQIKTLAGGPNAAKPLGQIFCARVDTADSSMTRFRYLVCLAPDRYRSDTWSSPPSGRWRIYLKNPTSVPVTVSLLIQTDQAAHPGASEPRSSYLIDPTYIAYNDDGRIRDTYSYGFRTMAQSADPAKDLDTADMVSRHGSLNSYSANKAVATIAGYRANDGRPAPYSSTGPRVVTNANRRAQPTAAFPTDDGYAHLGILADGASDGSIVAMQGTSFASAQATRVILQAWLDKEHDPYGTISIDRFLSNIATRQRAEDGWFKCPVVDRKIGSGRVVPEGRATKVPR
ncbi:S8 family serine peptidase [Shimia marina]|uniref:Peptidase S8/S53 domain-containing protein n=1 Tax=Shimia marina TaxID=321267 RepID=A0A0P1EQN1_9RHOB|nr:S8 family serine peptidase [Shimia marina]CUH52767.1 hypothetical protein SHM7688_02214 [Shimia marina]SFD87435.1 hypothetical protein SAMN04488037_10319 [Shimia marina]